MTGGNQGEEEEREEEAGNKGEEGEEEEGEEGPERREAAGRALLWGGETRGRVRERMIGRREGGFQCTCARRGNLELPF